MQPQIDSIETKSAETIFREMRDRIPRYLPEWTDYNDSDPGIALLQLFSLVGEGLSHQVSRLPTDLRAELLRLVGLRPRPALPASAALTFAAEPGRPGPFGVPPGAQVAAPGPDGRLVFETQAGLNLVATPLTMVLAFNGARYVDLTAEHEAPGELIHPFGAAATVGAALLLGFAPLPPGSRAQVFGGDIRLHLFKPPAFGGPPASSADPVLVPPVRLLAEYRNDAATTGWRRLDIVEDDTVAFLRAGTLRITGPRDSVPTVVRPGDDPLHWLRIRIAAGGYGSGQAPRIDALWPNTVMALQVATERDVFLAEGTGLPDQEHALRRTPVVAGSVELFDSEGTLWREVDLLAAEGADAPVFELRPGDGVLRFGDGEHGRIPGAGLELYARRYRHGGGADGNVDAGAITAQISTLRDIAEVTNRAPAAGGADAETEDELARAAPARLASGGRLVTAADFAAEAERAPQVARAHALPAFHPDIPALTVPGAVTLLIVPNSDRMPPPPPDDTLLRAIVDNMEARRPIGTELLAIGPSYCTVSVDATLDVAPGASLAAVQAEAAEALDRALSPLDWMFGLDFRPVMLIGTLQAVDGVLGVARFEVSVDGAPVSDSAAAVQLARNEVVAPGPHTVFTRYGADR